MDEAENITEEKNLSYDRSSAYPSITLSEAIQFSEKLTSAYPRSSFDRESAVKAMGYESVSGASSPKVAALVYYGLLEKKANTYKNSDLSQRILNFLTEKERQEAILEAVGRPKLFNALITEYAGRAIPSTLSSVLIRQHGISAKAADKVAQIFKDSADFAGIYKNGILQNPTEVSFESHPRESRSIEKDAGVEENARTQGPKQNISGDLTSVTLPSGAVISYPAHAAFHIQTNPSYLKVLADLEKIVSEAGSKEV